MNAPPDRARADRLENGVLVASEPLPHARTAAIGVWVDAGARHETAETAGVSHFLEHMAFKGTESRSARDIAEAIEDVGGQLNAYTSREQTAYYARVLADDVPLAVELLGDIAQRAAFDPEELERERNVILQEIGQVLDTPDDWVFDLFQETAFPDQPMGRSILGPAEVVKRLDAAAMRRHMAARYGGRGFTIVGAGAVDHDHLLDLARAQFGADAARDADSVAPARYRGGDKRVERDLEQAHLLLGVEAFSFADPDLYALNVFSTLVGGGMSSRLFQEIREERGLAYSIFSFASAYADTGLFGVYAGAAEDDLEELCDCVTRILGEVANAADEAELVRARNQLKAGTLMALESCSAVAEDLARQHQCFGRRVPTDEALAAIEAVDLEALRRVAHRLFENKSLTLTAIGPIAGLPERDALAHAFGI